MLGKSASSLPFAPVNLSLARFSKSPFVDACREDLEYKYLVINTDGAQVEWEPGENKVAKISDGLEVVDVWGARQEIVANGAKSAEGKEDAGWRPWPRGDRT